MSIDGGVRNTTMLLLLMCIPLLVASCQHTFGLDDQITAAASSEEPGSMVVAANHADSALEVRTESTVVEPELLVSAPRTDPAIGEASHESKRPTQLQTADRDADEPPIARLAATSGAESADKERELPQVAVTVQPEEKEADNILGLDATAEFEKWSVKLDDDIRNSVLREITAQLEEATANLDRQQAQLERLQVETEYYRMQVEHLQNRRQEWEPAE